MYSSGIQELNTKGISEGSFWIPITKGPKFVYGGKTYDVTDEWADRVVQNFNEISAYNYFPPVALQHRLPISIDSVEDIVKTQEEKLKRYGTIKQLQKTINEDDGEIYLAALIEWTEPTLEGIKAEEYKYISPKYGTTVDSNGNRWLDCLLEVSLVLVPHIKDIGSIQDYMPTTELSEVTRVAMEETDIKTDEKPKTEVEIEMADDPNKESDVKVILDKLSAIEASVIDLTAKYDELSAKVESASMKDQTMMEDKTVDVMPEKPVEAMCKDGEKVQMSEETKTELDKLREENEKFRSRIERQEFSDKWSKTYANKTIAMSEDGFEDAAYELFKKDPTLAKKIFNFSSTEKPSNTKEKTDIDEFFTVEMGESDNTVSEPSIEDLQNQWKGLDDSNKSKYDNNFANFYGKKMGFTQ